MAKELFERIDRQVGDILNDIKCGKVGLPDLQRPFVWKDNKVRDLLDSMLSGFPVGYVMLWSAPEGYENANHIGVSDKAYKRPLELVIDGQQRLTSLLGAMLGQPVKSKDFKTKRIRIAFHPIEKRFEVWTTVIEHDTNWISDISAAFEADANYDLDKFVRSVKKRINEGRERKGLMRLTEDEEDLISRNIRQLLGLFSYTIPTLRIKAIADEEQVAEIFKRVNSGGQNLNENNFIETLLAVYDNQMHDRIMQFCADSKTPADNTSYNRIIDVDTSHLIRMTVGLGFRRGRLQYAYKLLRGKDLETGVVSEETRIKSLTVFKDALDVVTNLNNWHTFLNLFGEAGYLKGSLVSSKYNVVFGYIIYLIGKTHYQVPAAELRHIIILWLFMTSVTSYYTSAASAESTIERIFADFRNVKSPDEFVAYLQNQIDLYLTDDFFKVTLPADLSSSAAVSPSWYAYLASLNVLGTNMLFSNIPASKFWLAGTHGSVSSIDRHHLYPKHHLATIGISSNRDRNQIANFTYLDKTTNIIISDNHPADYVEQIKAKIGEEAFYRSLAENAIPENFGQDDYFEFLRKRRILMAGIVRKAYLKLKGNSENL